MRTKLHIGNLHYSTEDFELEHWFAPYGTVRDAKVIRERQTARCGWVEMSSPQEAQAAALALHGKPRTGRVLTVERADIESLDQEALPEIRGPRPGGVGDRSGRRPTWGSLS